MIELSEDQLDMVSGGKWQKDAITIVAGWLTDKVLDRVASAVENGNWAADNSEYIGMPAP